MPSSKKIDKKETELLRALAKVQSQASLARVVEKCKDCPDLTFRLESMVSSGALAKAASSKEAPKGSVIPATKTYLHMVAETFYKKVVTSMDDRASMLLQKGGSSKQTPDVKGLGWRLFQYFVQPPPQTKPLVRDMDNFIKIYKSIADQIGIMKQLVYPPAEDGFNWGDHGIYAIDATAGNLLHKPSSVTVDLPGVCKENASDWALDCNWCMYTAVLQNMKAAGSHTIAVLPLFGNLVKPPSWDVDALLKAMDTQDPEGEEEEEEGAGAMLHAGREEMVTPDPKTKRRRLGDAGGTRK